ncbi:hypothetical protein ABM90_31185 [Rhodococcus erythropolis]|nr:hypothetical protein ABM90_31185 [Rhodococcus erythropolis]
MKRDSTSEQGWAWLAVLVAFALPIRAAAPLGIGALTPGVLLAILGLPVILASAIKFPRAKLLSGLMLFSAASGLILAQYVNTDHHVTLGIMQSTTLLIVCAAITLMAMLWCTTKIGLSNMVLAFCAGSIAQALLTPSTWEGNGWKYAFSWPVSIALLLLVRNRTKLIQLLVVIGIGAMSIANDYRSFFGFALLIAALLLMPKIRAKAAVKQVSPLIPMAVLATAGFAIYRASEWLSLNGYLGERNASVTEIQADRGVSLLLAGRPELAASIRLFFEQPFGFGPGVVPSNSDVESAKEGLQSVGAPTNTIYVNEYMFSNHIELHSLTADLWVNFGLVGLVLAVISAWMIAIRLSSETIAFKPRVWVLLVLIVGIWDLAFSPIQSNWSHWILALAVVVALNSQSNAMSSTRNVASPTSSTLHTQGKELSAP